MPFGPEPILAAPASAPISDEHANQLWRRANAWSPTDLNSAPFSQEYPDTVRRKHLQYQRWRVWQHDVTDLVQDRISEVFSNPELKEKLKAQVISALNPAVDIISAICQVYRTGASRVIEGDDEGTDTLHKILLEGKIDSLAPEWNRVGEFVGPLAVLPRVRMGRMSFDTLLPFAYDVILNSDDPTGAPTAIGYKTWADGSPIDFVVVDRFGYRFYRQDGADQRKIILVNQETWPGTASPFAINRYDAPLTPQDYHSALRHHRLVDGAVEVGLVFSIMSYIRRIQKGYLVTVIGDLSGMPTGQNLAEAERGIQAHLADTTESGLSINALNFDTPPKNFIDHIRFLYEALAESTGIQVAYSGQGSGAGTRIQVDFSHDGLTEKRNDQISYARDFDRDLSLAAIAASKIDGHKLRTGLPDLDTARDGFSVTYGGLARRFADPTQEIDYNNWALTRGIISINELVRRADPSITLTQAKERWERNVEDNKRWWNMVSALNMPTNQDVDDGPPATAAEANGAMGGRPPEDDDE